MILDTESLGGNSSGSERVKSFAYDGIFYKHFDIQTGQGCQMPDDNTHSDIMHS